MAVDDDDVDLSYMEDASGEEDPGPPRSGAVIAKGSMGKDYYSKPGAQGGSSLSAISRNMAQMSTQLIPQVQEVDVKTVDVKCNYAKDRTEVMGGLIMTFDRNGIWKMPVHQMEALRAIQRVRPGRFTVVTPEAPKPAPAPVVAAPVVVEEKPAPTPEKTEAAPQEKPPTDDKPKMVTPKKKKKGKLVTTSKD